jgi:hypothetical protein
MKTITKIISTIVIGLLSTNGVAQIKDAKTETVKIYGNCDMCKKTIEKSGNIKNVSKVDWNKDTKMAILTYNPKKTNEDAILKRIALVGYDSEKFLAPNDVYAKLPACCQYERHKKITANADTIKNAIATNTNITEVADPLKIVFDSYFLLKDALVESNGATASLKAKVLLTAIQSVKMEKLTMDEHMVWMKILSAIQEDAGHIAESKDAAHQREHFTSLSTNIYELIKVSKHTETVYYQHCPMYNDGKGANWLSKESTIKNPYYGSMMMSCGKTIETIK